VRRAALAAALAALIVPAPAAAARFAVGIVPGGSTDRVAARVEGLTGGKVSKELAPLGAIVVETRSSRGLARLPGVAYVERLGFRRAAFVPNDPLYTRQWYLPLIHGFDFWPDLIPPLAPVRVAVIDSGIDASHPEFAGRIALQRSFVGGSALTDQFGHGTFVAGVIAASTNNAQGIAGLAFPAQLMIAKVVRGNRSVSLEAEAGALRWAVDHGARVINLSLGGLRDPRNRDRDTFSPLEAAAVRYAVSRGAFVVAAVGNADQAPRAPWPYASYPAALPQVVGVSALGRDGSVPTFSDRDAIYNDLAAPGQEIVSTLPRALTAPRSTCTEQGYSICGPEDYRHAEGTSFAAPQVAAAAALVFSAYPKLRSDQVRMLLERTTDDVTPASGCRACRAGRDPLSGWGRLNVARALVGAATPPAPDRFEPNDDAGAAAARLLGAKTNITATVDFWDDQIDVYSLYLRRGQRLRANLDGPYKSNSSLALWKPGTTQVTGFSLAQLRRRVAQSARKGWRQGVSYRATTKGWYFLQVKIDVAGAGPYRLIVTKR
jgi:subtilisin family serine protease